MPRGAQRRDYPPLYDAPTRRKPSLRTSRNTKHYSPSTVEGVAPLSCTHRDGEWNLGYSICPARQSFTAPELEQYATATRSRKTDMTKTTWLQPPTAKNPSPRRRPHSVTDVLTRRNQSRTSRNTKHYSPSTVEGVAPLSCTPHDGEWTWIPHLSCPTTVYGFRDR